MKPAGTRRSERKEETLDPESWDAMRALGHRMVDEMMEYLERVRERPVWQPIPAGVKAALDALRCRSSPRRRNRCTNSSAATCCPIRSATSIRASGAG